MEGPSSARLPIGQIMIRLLFLAVGISAMSLVAIAPQLLPQFHSQWAVTHYALEATLRSLGHFDDRISLSTWYLSSIMLLAAMFSFGMAALSNSIAEAGWRRLGVLLIVFSADKATGLHHSFIHDFLYRLPFAINFKKSLLLFTAIACLGLVFVLLRPIWSELLKISKQLWIMAALCFSFSNIGLNSLANFFLPPTEYVFQASLLSFIEQCIDQIGGLFLLLGFLFQVQHQLSNRDM